MDPASARAKIKGANAVALLHSPLARDVLRPEQDEGVVRAAQLTNLAQEGIVLPRCGMEAIADGVDNPTAVWDPEPFDGWRYRVMTKGTVAGKAIAVRRRRVSPTQQLGAGCHLSSAMLRPVP